MTAYLVYKLTHLIGVFMVLLSLGGLIVFHSAGRRESLHWRKLAATTNGIGLVIVFIAGLGLVARLEMDWPWPVWVFLKILIWIIFGLLIALAHRAPQSAELLWWGSLLLAGVAAYLANFKPF